MGIGSEIFEIDDGIPGGVYLCQVNQDVSCGACCGLYNVAGVDPSSLKRMLKRRTDLFQTTARTLGALDDFARKVKQSEAQQRPFPEFHHCPYLGLIGDGRTCVGCLLHPLAASNEGIDYRGLSHYGGMACRIYFCNTMLSLNKHYKQILRMAIDDWYVYGLVVTAILQFWDNSGDTNTNFELILLKASSSSAPWPASHDVSTCGQVQNFMPD